MVSAMQLKLSPNPDTDTFKSFGDLSRGGGYAGVPPVNNQASNIFVVSQHTDVAVLLLVHSDKMITATFSCASQGREGGACCLFRLVCRTEGWSSVNQLRGGAVEWTGGDQ